MRTEIFRKLNWRWRLRQLGHYDLNINIRRLDETLHLCRYEQFSGHRKFPGRAGLDSADHWCCLSPLVSRLDLRSVVTGEGGQRPGCVTGCLVSTSLISPLSSLQLNIMVEEVVVQLPCLSSLSDISWSLADCLTDTVRLLASCTY